MNTESLKSIINRIKVGEELTLEQIAKKAKVNRSHLSTIINSGDSMDVTGVFIGKLTKAFPQYFDSQQKPTEGLSEILSNLKELRGYTIAILTEQQAGQEVMIGSLERLERRPAGELSALADKLAIKLQETLNRINKSTSDGDGKARK